MPDGPRTDLPGRRGVLGLGIGGAAAISALLGAPAVAGTAASAASAAPGTAGTAAAAPRTRARRFSGPGVLRPGFDVDTLAVSWTAGTPRLRTVAADGRRGPWRAVRAGCPAGAGDTAGAAGARRPATAFVDAGGATAVELEGAAGTRAVAIGGGSSAAAAAAGGVSTLAAGGRRYLSRAAWGADESLRFDSTGAERWVPAYFPVQTLTVHHTATVNDDPDPAARMRAIYRYQAIDEKFGDFGYHFAVDEAGNLYEGRYSGTDSLPGFSPDGRMVNGAHVGGYNAGNVGIAILGDLTDRDPTPAAYDTLVLLLAVLTLWHGLDPLARARYVNPISGVTADVPVVAGHRDWPFATQCPGNHFYPTLGRLRSDVAALRGAPAR